MRKPLIFCLLFVAMFNTCSAANLHNNTPYTVTVYFQATEDCTQIAGADNCMYTFDQPKYSWLSHAFEEHIDFISWFRVKGITIHRAVKNCIYLYHGSTCDSGNKRHNYHLIRISDSPKLCYVYASCA